MLYPSVTVNDVPLTALQLFFMIFVRTMAVLSMVPPFDNRSMPVLVKGGLGVAFSLVLYGAVGQGAQLPLLTLIPFCLAALCELLRGILLGLCVKAVFAGVQLAGQMMSIQMGFAIANVMDPVTQTQISVVTQIKDLFAMLIFLVLDGHHWLLRGLSDSFSLIPLFSFQLPESLFHEVVKLGETVFVLSVKLGAPVMASLFITNVALGLIARTVPQMNVFIVAFPLNIGVGLLFIMLSLPYVALLLSRVFQAVGGQVHLIMGAIP